MRRQPKASTRPGGDPVATCGACRQEVPLYRGRLSIHGSRLGQGLCPGAGEEAKERAKTSRATEEPKSRRRPVVGPEQMDLLKTLKGLLRLSGWPDVRVFVASEGLELHLFSYAALKGLLPHLVRYEGQLLSSSFSQVCVLIPASKVKRLCGFLMRQSKRAGRSVRAVDERQLRLF